MSNSRRRRGIEREDLYRLKLVGDVDTGRDGTRVAYVVKALGREQDDYVGNIHVACDGRTLQFTSGDKDSTPRWSPDCKALAFLSGRAEKSQIFVIRTDGGEAFQLTKQRLGAGEPVWSRDSRLIAFAGPTEFPKAPDTASEEKEEKRPKTKIIDRALYKLDGSGFTFDRRSHIFTVDVESKEVRQLTDGDCNDRSPTWSPDGRHVAFAANRSEDWDTRRGSDIWMVSVEGGSPRRITHGHGSWSSPVFSPDGSNLAFVGFTIDDEGESDNYSQLWITDWSGSENRNLLADTDFAVGRSLASDWVIAGDPGLVWNHCGLFFPVSVKGASAIFRWDGEAITRVTAEGVDAVSFAVADDGHIAYARSDATHPAEVYRRRDGTEEQVSHENHELLSDIQLEEPERLVVTGADGEPVEGWILKPHGLQTGLRYPLLLYIHGGPQSAYGHTFFHELQWWSAQGFGVAYCNPHGSASYGRAFQNAIKHDWGNRDYLDVMAFTDAIAELGWVDPQRIAAAGGSYGGYMVNWLAGHTDRYAAFCAQRSICNMVSQGGTSDFSPFRQDRAGGTPEGNAEVLWNQSPLKFAANVRTPTLILHQELDHRCPIEQGEQWFAALKRMGVPSRFIRFPEESHGLSRTGKPSRRYDRLGYMLDWFLRYV